MTRPNATYGAPCTSSKNRSLRGPFRKHGAASKMTGGRASRMSRAAVLHRSRGSALARPQPAVDVLWHGSPTRTTSARAILCQRSRLRMPPTTASSAPAMSLAHVARNT
eukprot:12504953-Alexandrium_andersonii.AAC.1